MADVHVLPGIERRDITGPPVDSAKVLSDAIANGVTDVVVVGRDRRGKQYIAAASNDADKVVGILMAAAVLMAKDNFQQGMCDPRSPAPEDKW